MFYLASVSPCQLPPGGQAEANPAASCLPVVEAVYLLHTENQECQSYATLRNYSDCTVFKDHSPGSHIHFLVLLDRRLNKPLSFLILLQVWVY